jgi:hypothetical protein
MTEVEQLRKEVNELRERLVRLESRVNPIGPGVYHQPIFTPTTSPQPNTNPWPLQPPNTNPWPLQPPYIVTCAADDPGKFKNFTSQSNGI